MNGNERELEHEISARVAVFEGFESSCLVYQLRRPGPPRRYSLTASSLARIRRLAVDRRDTPTEYTERLPDDTWTEPKIYKIEQYYFA